MTGKEKKFNEMILKQLYEELMKSGLSYSELRRSCSDRLDDLFVKVYEILRSKRFRGMKLSEDQIQEAAFALAMNMRTDNPVPAEGVAAYVEAVSQNRFHDSLRTDYRKSERECCMEDDAIEQLPGLSADVAEEAIGYAAIRDNVSVLQNKNLFQSTSFFALKYMKMQGGELADLLLEASSAEEILLSVLCNVAALLHVEADKLYDGEQLAIVLPSTHKALEKKILDTSNRVKRLLQDHVSGLSL